MHNTELTDRPAGMRPAWVEINLDNLNFNIDAVRRQVPDSKLLAAVKANAYGHGILETSRELVGKVDCFGVAFLHEAIALRKDGIADPILIFGPGITADAAAIARYKLDQTLTSWSMAQALAAAGTAAGNPVNVHIKVDTGMGRLGLRPAEVPDFVKKIAGMQGLRIAGIYSHFPGNMNNFADYTRNQLSIFQELLADLSRKGYEFPLRHLASSSTIFQLPEAHLDMVRPGSFLYGLSGTNECRPVMSIKAMVWHVNDLPPDSYVSYRLTYRTTAPSRIAVLPLGYADGLARALSNRGHAIIRGRKYPVAGLICMDQTMIDTGGSNVQSGDEAVLLGRQGDEEITVNDMVDLVEGTSTNEVTCRISDRLPRVYMRQGKITGINHGNLPAPGSY